MEVVGRFVLKHGIVERHKGYGGKYSSAWKHISVIGAARCCSRTGEFLILPRRFIRYFGHTPKRLLEVEFVR